MFRTEHNLETGEIIEIALTANEIKDLEKQYAEEATRIALEQAEAEAQATAKAALLARLGITADEAKLLLAQSWGSV